MKKIFFIIILILVNLLTNYTTNAQQVTFTDSTYIKKLVTLYGNAPERKTLSANSKLVSREEIDSFLTVYNSDWKSLEPFLQNRKDIIEVSNYMLKSRINKNIEFYKFLQIISSLKKSSKSNFDIWLTKLVLMSRSNKTTSTGFKEFVNQIHALVYKKYVYESNLYNWKTSSNKYQFTLNNEKFQVSFKKTDLIGIYELADTVASKLVIKSTQGRYDPLIKRWFGSKGRVTWEKYGYSAEEMYAVLSDYEIYLINTKYRIDSVTYYNKKLLSVPAKGLLEDQATPYAEKRNVFPTFSSYRFNYSVKSQMKSVSLRGGVKMEGARLYTSGTEVSPAVLKLVDKGKVFMKVQSKSIYQDKDILNTKKAKVSLYISKGDSITHPESNITLQNNTLKITRNTKGAGQNPFFNSYQRLEMFCDQIEWELGSKSLFFYSKQEAIFKSYEFFSREEFESLKMYDEKNPLFSLNNFVREKTMKSFRAEQNTSFHVLQYARFLKKDPAAVRHRLMDLWYLGYVDYSVETQMVTVKSKILFHINSFLGLSDYDNIFILSNLPNATRSGYYGYLNAIYDLSNNDLTLRGVNDVTFSRKKGVRAKIGPKKKIVVKKDRYMELDGVMQVGFAKIYSDNFKFDYVNFNIKFQNADSIKYKVVTKIDRGYVQAADIQSVQEKVTGEVIIDAKGNRSGVKAARHYPKFKSTQDSYVYYDKRNKNGDIYNREKFYFKCYPFELDSMAYLMENSLNMRGYMETGGIVPGFEEKLSMQQDESLGFVHQTGSGVSLFKGKGNFSSDGSKQATVSLSNQGFGGAGEVNWLATKIQAEDFIFFPDSMNAKAKNFTIQQTSASYGGGEYPAVTGEEVYINWNSAKDKIVCTTDTVPLLMYGNKAKMKGELTFTPKTLTGNGDVEIEEGIIKSVDEIDFKENSFFTEKADFSLKDYTKDTLSMQAYNLKSYIDFNAGKSVFQSNTNGSKVSFSQNDYVNKTNHFVWHQGKRQVDLNHSLGYYTRYNSGEIPLDSVKLLNQYKFGPGAFVESDESLEFISTNINQDSLKFRGATAVFDAKKNEIIVENVRKIEIADIQVVPSTEVIIRKKADMKKLMGTSVKAKGKHNIADVDIKIFGLNKYNASSGTYLYIDESGNTQNIQFSTLYYDEQKAASVANADIKEEMNFTLSPDFKFHGDVHFNAKDEYLLFEGLTKMNEFCDVKHDWFYFSSHINPDSVYIPMNPNLNMGVDNNEIAVFADIMAAADSVHIFPAILETDPFGGTSKSIFTVRDSIYYLHCDKKNKGHKYVITTKEKHKYDSLPGNYLKYDTKNCYLNTEGKFDYIRRMHPGVKNVASGKYRHNLKTNRISLDNMIYFDFHFSKKLTDIIVENLNSAQSYKPIDPAKDSYRKNLNELLGISQTNSFLQELSINPLNPSIPKNLKHQVVFSDVNLKWDQKSESFKSSGDIGIITIGDKLVNKYFKGYFQIKKKYRGDVIKFYFETGPNQWFYFYFQENMLFTFSSNSDFNNAIDKMGIKERKAPDSNFRFLLTNETEKNNFVEIFSGSSKVEEDDDDDDSEVPTYEED